MTKTTKLTMMLSALAACTCLVTMGGSAARADTTDEMLEIMKRKGEISDSKYRDLKAKHEAEKAGPAAGSYKDGAPAGEVVTALPKGVGVRIGQVDVKLSGDISFFGIEDFPQHRAVFVDGGLLNSGLHNDSNSIRAGLLPSSIQVGLSTTQNGYDIGAFFGMYVGGNSNSNVNINEPNGLGQSDIDFRQVYGTIGTKTGGTFKFGRDIGIFGAEAILNDATIFGSGTPQGNFAPGNTTLGRIGVGYIYTDFLPQISYTTPDWNGFTATVGLITPYNDVNISLEGNTEKPIFSGTVTGKDAPMVQGRLKYSGAFGGSGCGYKDMDCNSPGKITLWTSGLFQDHQVENGDNVAAFKNPGASIESWAVDGGVKVDWGGFSLVGYGYTAEGVGTTGLFWNAISQNGDTRTSSGGYIQGSYTFWDRLTIGGSYGISQLDANSFDRLNNPFLVKFTESEIGYAKYKLTSWVALQAEYIHTDEQNHSGGHVKDDAVAVGTTFFW